MKLLALMAGLVIFPSLSGQEPLSRTAQAHPIKPIMELSPLPADESPPALRLTLLQAENFALKNNPRISSAHLNAEAVREQIREARSNFFPQIYGELNAVYAPENTRMSALEGLNNPSIYSRQSDGIILNQLITDFGRTFDLTESAQFRTQAAESRMKNIQALVFLEVDRAYLNLLKNQAILRVAHETVKARQLVDDQISVLMKNQLKSELDLSFEAVNLAEAKLLLLEGESNVSQSEAELSAALGFPNPMHFELEEVPLDFHLPDSDNVLQREALNQRPDLLALRREVDAAHRFTAAQQAAQYPKISAIAGAGVNPVYDDKGLKRDYYTAGVNVEIPLTNGGSLDAHKNEARFLEQAAEQNVIDAENIISRDVRAAWLNANTAKKRIDVTTELIHSAAQSQQLAEARYRLGTSSIVELSRAQLNYTQAELQDTSARYDYLISRAVLNFSIGSSAPENK